MDLMCEELMNDQQYSYDGRPGCVLRHRSRATGTTIGVYKADQAGLDGSAGDWIAICEEHGEQYAFANLRHARAHYATAPWCRQCYPDGPPGVPDLPPAKLRGPKSSDYVGISGLAYLSLNQRLYTELGSPTYVQLQWIPRAGELVITPADEGAVNTGGVYRVRVGRRADGREKPERSVHALTPIRASGLTNGKYRPQVDGTCVTIKAAFKVEDQAHTDDEAESQD